MINICFCSLSPKYKRQPSHFLDFYCYPGAQSNEVKNEIKKIGHGPVKVETLLSLENYFDKGYHLFTDNFYTNIQLAQ